MTCTVGEVEDCVTGQSRAQRNGESGRREALTFFNAILVGMPLVHRLPLIRARNTLHAVIEVVLGRSTLPGFLAFCGAVSMP